MSTFNLHIVQPSSGNKIYSSLVKALEKESREHNTILAFVKNKKTGAAEGDFIIESRASLPELSKTVVGISRRYTKGIQFSIQKFK